MRPQESSPIDEFFADNVTSRKLFEVLAHEVELLGETSVRVTKSQIAFHRRKSFAFAWMPGKYLKGSVAPLVLTMSFPSRDDSSRWKQITQIGPHRFTHHLELCRKEDIDEQVKAWLRAAWSAA